MVLRTNGSANSPSRRDWISRASIHRILRASLLQAGSGSACSGAGEIGLAAEASDSNLSKLCKYAATEVGCVMKRVGKFRVGHIIWQC